MMKTVLTTAILLSTGMGTAAAETWHHPLYLANGGWWQARIAVRVTNPARRELQGEPIGIRVGKDKGQADLAGAEIGALRVCDGAGNEMLFNVTGPDGRLLTGGPVPANGMLTLPVECSAEGDATYYVYFDNPSAWACADFLDASVGIRNKNLEDGSQDAATGWKNDAGDDQHRAFWTREDAHSGKGCLKTVVAQGAEATWIATRQSGIHIVGGAKYVMQAWVKAQDVRGSAGWYIHVGNREKSMMISPMLPAGEGTFDWRQVRAEFTAPADATIASLGTVLRGTGTAWFDDVTLDCVDESRLKVRVESPERLELDTVTRRGEWYDDNPGDDVFWAYRFPVTVLNLTKEEMASGLVSVNLSGLSARLPVPIRREAVRVTDGDDLRPHYWLDETLLFPARVPKRSAVTFYVYLSADSRIPQTDRETYAKLLQSDSNRVANFSFEEGDRTPAVWVGAPATQSADSSAQLDSPGRFGKRCVRLHVSHDTQPTWRGWHQDVAVTPNREYLFAAWLKCEDLQNGSLLLHAHYKKSDGSMCATVQYASAGSAISGTQDWTLMHGRFRMPHDAARFQLHLTMNATGTAWHDGVVLAEVIGAVPGALEVRTAPTTESITAWPVDAVRKVFREDLPPTRIGLARVTAARNESEPLQLALRGDQAISEVTVKVDTPVNGNGKRLPAPEITVVGYVPVDYPTNYYSSTSPVWHRKQPTASARCDGWPGWWPDPLLPKKTFSLAANTTQPVWITFRIPKTAPAGDYRGTVRFLTHGNELKQVPFTIHVWDFTLSDGSQFPAIYDVRPGPQWRRPGRTTEALYRQLWQFMAERRLCPDSVHPEPKIRYQDGKVVADFAEFDKAASYYFDELNLPHSYTPWFFYCFGWGHPPKPLFGEAPYAGEYPYEGADRSQLRPEYKRVYQSCLRVFWDHVKERGWADKFVLYISDEPYHRLAPIREQMKALCQMIHEVAPDIRIYCSTWQHYPEWDGSLDVWGIGHDGRVATEKMAELRSAGDTVWFTTDGQMCLDTPYCAVERLLPHYCFKYGVDAYEFWGVNWLTYDPYQFGWHSYIHQSGQPGETFYIRYPNGDGYLMYPGAAIGHDGPVSSVRLEQAREGVEDYAYLRLLSERIDRAARTGLDTEAAQAALEAAQELVTIPNAGGRYSTKMLTDTNAVFEVKEALARAIEDLPQ